MFKAPVDAIFGFQHAQTDSPAFSEGRDGACQVPRAGGVPVGPSPQLSKRAGPGVPGANAAWARIGPKVGQTRDEGAG